MEKINVSFSGDVAVVTFTQPKFLDVIDIQQLDCELFEVADSSPSTILLDMSAVNLLSSAALNRLIMLHKCSKAKGKELQLAGITP